MRRGGRFLATPLGKRYTTRWVYYMFESDARLQGWHIVLVMAPTSQIEFCSENDRAVSYTHLRAHETGAYL
eukprot:8920399-Pyramimonas_sp.AAC.1